MDLKSCMDYTCRHRPLYHTNIKAILYLGKRDIKLKILNSWSVHNKKSRTPCHTKHKAISYLGKGEKKTKHNMDLKFTEWAHPVPNLD